MRPRNEVHSTSSRSLRKRVFGLRCTNAEYRDRALALPEMARLLAAGHGSEQHLKSLFLATILHFDEAMKEASNGVVTVREQWISERVKRGNPSWYDVVSHSRLSCMLYGIPKTGRVFQKNGKGRCRVVAVIQKWTVHQKLLHIRQAISNVYSGEEPAVVISDVPKTFAEGEDADEKIKTLLLRLKQKFTFLMVISHRLYSVEESVHLREPGNPEPISGTTQGGTGSIIDTSSSA